MWPASFWPASYWPASYWPKGAAVAPTGGVWGGPGTASESGSLSATASEPGGLVATVTSSGTFAGVTVRES